MWTLRSYSYCDFGDILINCSARFATVAVDPRQWLFISETSLLSSLVKLDPPPLWALVIRAVCAVRGPLWGVSWVSCAGAVQGPDAGQPAGHRGGLQPAEGRGRGQREGSHWHQLRETQDHDWSEPFLLLVRSFTTVFVVVVVIWGHLTCVSLPFSPRWSTRTAARRRSFCNMSRTHTLLRTTHTHWK